MTPSPEFPQQSQAPSSNRLWLAVLAAGAFFCCLVPGGCLAYFASGPEGGVRAGNQLSKDDLAHIHQHVKLADGEEVISFYDSTMKIDGSEAAVLTSKRLVTWTPSLTSELPVSDIKRIDHESDPLLGELLDVTGASGTLLRVEVAPFNDGQRFVDALSRTSGVEVQRRTSK